MTRYLLSGVPELRAALRALRGTPVFTLITVAVLAIGIGATTAIFSLVDHVLLADLPYGRPGELVRLYQVAPDQPVEGSYVSEPYYDAWTTELNGVAEIAAAYTYAETGVDLAHAGGAERLRLLSVTPRYFAVLGSDPALGRGFTEREQQDSARVVVLSDALWRTRFGGDRAVLGRSVSLGGESHTVIGVARPALEDPVAGAVDIWKPLPIEADEHVQNHRLTVIARLRSGVTVAGLAGELDVLSSRLRARFPEVDDERGVAVGLKQDTVKHASTALLVLLGAVGLMLLIVCVNVANLMLVRATARQREFAVRAALGSGGVRIVRQLLLESLLLALLGGAAGVLLGAFLLDGLKLLAASSIPRAQTAVLDARVLGFAALVSCTCALLFGLLPSLRFARVNPSAVFRESGRTATSGRGRNRLRGTLVGAQVALAFMLLSGAAVLALSFHRLTTTPLGFGADEVMTFELNLPSARYDAARRVAAHEEVLARIEAVPGVAAAAATSRLPGTGSYHSWGAAPENEPDSWIAAEQRIITGDLFGTLHIPLLAGRLLDARDDESQPARAVVSSTLADALFPGQDAIGRRISAPGGVHEIVGIVADVALTPDGAVAATMYRPHRQYAANRNWALTYVVRASASAEALLPRLRAEIAAVDPQLVVHRPMLLADVLGQGVAQQRFTVSLMVAFAAVALLLAALGLYGVVSFTVKQRRRELGIRAALGARPAQLRELVVRQGLRITVAGVAIGLGGAVAIGRVLASLVFETRPADPLVLAGTALLMLGITAAATLVPAAAATRVPPREVLLEE